MAGRGPPTSLDHAIGVFLTLLGSVIALAMFLTAFNLLRRARLLANTPASRLRSAAQGYVELQGTAKEIPGLPMLRVPVSGEPCVWWRVDVERKEPGKSGEMAWVFHGSHRSSQPFLLDDGTGVCLVDPHGAEDVMRSDRKSTSRGHRANPADPASPQESRQTYRYDIDFIVAGDAINAIGEFRTQALVVQDSTDPARDRSEQLQRVQGMLAELHGVDVNALRWSELAPAVAAQFDLLRSTGASEMHLLGKPGDRRPLNLTTGARKQQVREYVKGAISSFITALLLGALIVACYTL